MVVVVVVAAVAPYGRAAEGEGQNGKMAKWRNGAVTR